jgi:two-component system, cell cycle sensor histidine kinase and response regulator CckA
MTARSPKDARILLVDDHAANLYTVDRLLRADGYKDLNCQTDSAKGLAVFAEWRPDIVLLDLSMPEIDGFEFMSRARPLVPEGEYLPILVITGDELTATRQRALSSGASDFLNKPIDGTELVLRVHNLLEIRFLSETLRKQNQSLEEVVRERTRTLREQAALIARAHEAILLTELDGTIRFWNDGAERLYGWQATEAVGRPAVELLGYEPTSEMAHAMETVRVKGEWAGEFHQVTRMGRQVIVESRWSLILHEDDSPPSVLVFNTDVTEKKHLEMQFLRAQRLECIGMLAGGIAHDLNNMLTPIRLGIDMLQMRSTEADRRSLIDTLRTSVERGAGFVHQILSFARGNTGDRLALPVAPVIRETGKLLERSLPKSITVSVSLPADLWLTQGEPTHLSQILVNLCVNARDAMIPGGGELTIRAGNLRIDEPTAAQHSGAQPGPYVRIEVADTGTGMSEEVMSRIFEPFFTTKEEGKGTGLGLTLVQQLVTRQGGFVQVFSEVGRGSQFIVHLPATESGTTPLAPKSVELPQGLGEMVLVIDDEASIRQLAHAILTAHGYRVLSAGDGAEGVGVFARHLSDDPIVVTDLNMPVLDGVSMIRTLRMIDPEVRIIVMSGDIANYTKDPDRPLEADAFVDKPFTAESLLRLVRQMAVRAPV